MSNNWTFFVPYMKLGFPLVKLKIQTITDGGMCVWQIYIRWAINYELQILNLMYAYIGSLAKLTTFMIWISNFIFKMLYEYSFRLIIEIIYFSMTSVRKMARLQSLWERENEFWNNSCNILIWKWNSVIELYNKCSGFGQVWFLQQRQNCTPESYPKI